MDLTNSTTANIVAGKYYYDLELVNTSTSTVTRLIEGVARVTGSYTIIATKLIITPQYNIN